MGTRQASGEAEGPLLQQCPSTASVHASRYLKQTPGCLAIASLPDLGRLSLCETHPLPLFRLGMQNTQDPWAS